MIYKNGVVNEVNYSNEGIVVKAVTDTAQDNKIKANL